MKYIFTLYLFCFFAHLAPAQSRYYVHATATGTNDGSSWGNAFTNLQDALQIAQAGDLVWVGAGTYKPTANTDRLATFQPVSGVRLFGGFNGTETTVTQRDWIANPVILSGDIGVQGDSTDNVYNVLVLLFPDSTTLVDGLEIRDGNADFNGITPDSRDRRKCGGGLYIDGSNDEAYCMVQNCRFIHNTARSFGGGLMINGGGDGSVAPTIKNCYFERNRAVASGGGLARWGSSWVDRADVTGCTFIHNFAGANGGGLYFNETERTDQFDLYGCHFEANRANNIGGAAIVFMGRSAGGRIAVKTTLFKENKATNCGGLYFFTLFNINEAVIDSCEFNTNYALNGNTKNLFYEAYQQDISIATNYAIINNKIRDKDNIYSIGYINISISTIDYPLLFSSNIIENIQDEVLNVNAGEVIFNNNKLLNNINFYFSISQNYPFIISNLLIDSVENSQEALFAVEPYGPSDKTIQIKNATIENSKLSKGLIYFNQSGFYLKIDLINNYFNKNHILIFDFSSRYRINFNNCALSDIDTTIFWGNNIAKIIETYSNILTNTTPLFTNPAAGDFTLQPCSPLLNTGSNDFVTTATDIAGHPRIQSGVVDIGAYEASPPALAAQPMALPSCPDTTSGSIAFEVQGACAPLIYNWSGPAGATGTQLSGLAPGAYQFTITDTKGSFFTLNAAIPQALPPTLLTTTTPVICGDTLGGTATATATGSGPFSYQWPGSTDSLRTNLAPGTYPVTVTDARGCSAAGTVIVDRTGGLDIHVDVQPITCYGAANGSFIITPENGKAPFVYLWQDGTTFPGIANLGPGNYLGTLTDGFGCTLQWQLPLNEPAQLLATASVVNATDSAAANGSIVLTPQGGTQPYTVLWNTEDNLFMLSALEPGIYSATITDANDCTYDTTVVVGITVGTQEIDPALAIQIQPNPFTTDLRILVPAQVSGIVPELTVLDVYGRVMLHQQLSAFDQVVPTALFPAGLYFWRVNWADKYVQGGRVVKSAF